MPDPLELSPAFPGRVEEGRGTSHTVPSIARRRAMQFLTSAVRQMTIERPGHGGCRQMCQRGA